MGSLGEKLEIIKRDLYALSLKRIKHIEGVAESALEIKNRHFPEIDDDTALCAAFMHDFTKEYTKEQHNEIFEKYAISLDECEKRTEKLWHAKSAYALAKYEYALPDDICTAILYHTTGRAGMTDLEKVIYLADYIEKNRTFVDCVDVRDTYNMLCENKHPTALDSAILYSLDLTISDLIENKRLIHKDTFEARNYLLEEGIE